MAKLTDRYDDKNIIELAKKDFEKEQRSKLPSIIVELASKGIIYPETNPLRSGKVEMRYMTAYDEDILTNTSYMREGVILDKLLEELIISDIDYKTVAQVDKDSLILNARIVSYGAEYPVKINDPKTKKELNRVVDLSKLTAKPFTLKSDKNGEFEYIVSDDVKLKFVFLSSKDIDSIGKDTLISGLLSKMIQQVNNTRSSVDIEHFIQYEFLAKDSKDFRTFISENTPGIDYNYEFEGDDGGTFTARFQVGPDFFWF